jgi:lysophospholipase L1-like esterase
MTLATVLLAAACGGGAPTAPATPSPPPVGTNSVAGVVFYDQNDNGAIDGDEPARLQGVRVVIGAQTGASGAGGQFSVTALPGGAQTVSVQADSLPSYFRPGRLPTLTLPLPAGTVVPVPLTLPTGTNRTHQYLAFGDSITEGTGSARRTGWATPLELRLREHWGLGDVIVDGVRGSRSIDGAARVRASLDLHRPAFILVLYGTNDWNGRCQSIAPEACFTVGALRDIVRTARAAGTLAIVGTIVPAHPGLVPAERNRWIQLENDLIRAMVQQEGAVLADTWGAFGPDQGAWSPLFFDDLHPNEGGYARISDAFFQAIAGGRAR